MIVPTSSHFLAAGAVKHTTACAQTAVPRPLLPSACRALGSTWWQAPHYQHHKGLHTSSQHPLLDMLSTLFAPLTYTIAALLHIVNATMARVPTLPTLPHLQARRTPTNPPTPSPPSLLPPSVERSLAFLLHNAPNCAGCWEHLVSPNTLSSLTNITWQSRGARNDVDIALCPARAPDRLHKVRGQGVIQAPASLVLSLVEGVHTVQQWEPAYRDGEVLRDVVDAHTNVRTQLLWSRHAAGPLVSDRDFLVEQTRLQLPCGTYVVHTVSTQDQQHDANDTSKSPKTLQNNLPMVAPARRKGCVRAMLGDCGWVVRPIDAHTCHVTYVAQVDPKGSVPAWLVNKFATSMPMAIHRVRGAAERLVERARLRAAAVVSHPLTDFD